MADHRIKDLHCCLGIGLRGHADGELGSLISLLGELFAIGTDYINRSVHLGAVEAVLVSGGYGAQNCLSVAIGRLLEGDGITACNFLLVVDIVDESAEGQVRELRGYGLVRVRADLEGNQSVSLASASAVSLLHIGAHGAVQKVERAAEGGLLADTLDLEGELVGLLLDCGALGVCVGAVGALEGEGSHALEHVGDFLGGALSGLAHGDAVVRVAVALGQAIDLGGHTGRDLKAGGIILGRVDSLA